MQIATFRLLRRLERKATSQVKTDVASWIIRTNCMYEIKFADFELFA